MHSEEKATKKLASGVSNSFPPVKKPKKPVVAPDIDQDDNTNTTPDETLSMKKPSPGKGFGAPLSNPSPIAPGPSIGKPPTLTNPVTPSKPKKPTNLPSNIQPDIAKSKVKK